MTAYGALQPVADHAAYGRRCPKPDLDDIGEVRTSVSGFHQASGSPWREVRKSFREGLMKRLKLAAAPGQKLLLKELLAG